MADGSSNRARPWADLPVELVDAVVDHLDFFSATRVTGVCTSWARAVATNASLPFASPCLLMTTPEEDDLVDAHEDKECTFQLLDHSRGKELSFPAIVAAMCGARRWVGGKDDWLATVDKHCNAELVNPYTGRRISLPSLATIPEVLIEEDRIVFEGSAYTFFRVVVYETPSGTGDGNGYLAVAMFSVLLLAITRAGDKSWTHLIAPLDPTMTNCVECTDVVLHKGKAFAVSWSGDIYTWDMASDWFPYPESNPIRPPHIIAHYACRWNLAESVDGRRLLLVAFPYDHRVHGAVFLYEMDVDAVATGGTDGAGWCRPHHSLFLGANFPFLARVVNDQDDRELLRSNCVYHTEGQLSEAILDLDQYCFHVYDLEDKTYKPCSWGFYENHKGSYQTPIWFRPTLKSFRQAN